MLQEHALRRALPGTGSAVDFTGVWKNGLGSTATLTQAGYKLSGIYVSTVSSTGEKAQGDLQGYVNGDLVSFVVHWDKSQAITAWVGQLDPTAGVDTLCTLWQMTKQVTTGAEWSSINAGTDTFTRA